MRWKISHHGHDPRQIDLVVALVLLFIIVAACRYFAYSPAIESKSVLIEPGQSVRW